MIARFAGAGLGLLAFAVAIIAGLIAQNPVTVTLSRGILALFVFCLIGLVLGKAAELVVAEHGRSREAEIRKRYHENPASSPQSGAGNRSTESAGASIGT